MASPLPHPFHAFDSHLHLTAPQFTHEEALDIIQHAVSVGVTSVMNVATDFDSLTRSLELMPYAQASGLNWYQAAATTPHDASHPEKEAFFQEIERQALANRSTFHAIGETGLDYYYEHSPKKEQQDLFHRYIELASRLNLPLIIHCRDAFPDFFDIIRSYAPLRGVLHCFTGTKKDASKLLDLGWYVSLSGIVTYTKSTEEIKETAKFLPEDRILIETDSPYLAPIPKRGKKNQPAFLLHILESIATLRGVSIDELAQKTYQNAKALFGEIRHEKPIGSRENSA